MLLTASQLGYDDTKKLVLKYLKNHKTFSQYANIHSGVTDDLISAGDVLLAKP